MNITHLPNAITVTRLFLVPVLILALREGDYQAALLIFLVAGISDALDGYIAKRFDAVTHLGAVLDPLADKLLLVSAYVVLTIIGHIPFWLMLTVAFRDLLIVGGYLAVTSVMGAVHMRPSYLSKFNTLMQIILIIAILSQHAGLYYISEVSQILIYLVFLTTVASGAHYLWLWIIRKDIEPVTQGEKNDNK
ncbi:MAG: CDP-alcohol phosphatidyltransferase family protein [Gammaproteobacteria bacterium]|nr:MAG: CDP-alcohol phosphatidyltransferase family protein [Gammaproteobacteria bacterium]